MTHHHDHHHHHGDVTNLKVAFWLNLGFALFEIVGGIWTRAWPSCLMPCMIWATV